MTRGSASRTSGKGNEGDDEIRLPGCAPGRGHLAIDILDQVGSTGPAATGNWLVSRSGKCMSTEPAEGRTGIRAMFTDRADAHIIVGC
jgi:hypothetical protein